MTGSMANLGIFVRTCLFIVQLSTCYGDDAAMFPYGPQAGDKTVTDTQNTNDLQLDIPREGIVFYGRRHGHVALAYHGAFYFTREYPAHHASAKPPRFLSPPFAAPLYYRASFLTENPVGRVYYRYVKRNSAFPNLDVLSNMVNGRVVGTTSFNATYAVIATWSNVTDSAAVEQCGISMDANACQNLPRNTFQAVLLADTYSTFVIFNYASVVEDSLHAKAGIYAGDNVRWTPVLPHNEQLIEGIERIHGTSDKVGRFIFKVSDNRVVRGGCTTSLSGVPLEASPKFAGMYGGEIIEVSGPCLNQYAEIQCKFGDSIVKGRRINDHKAECTVPILKERGKISLILSASSSPHFNFVTDFTIVLPGRLPAGVKTDYLGPEHGWNETDASSLTLHWDNDRLSLDPKAKVQVNLVGYREDEIEAYWTTLVTLADQVSNSKGNPSYMGQSTGVTFDPAQFRCSGEQCHQYELGIIEVKLVEGQASTQRSLFSHNLPLGWFITDAMEAEHGHEWPSALCTQWDERDKQDVDWLDELLNCPCTMNQAMADFGRWQPDVGCNIFTGSVCSYHQGAVHCVRSVHPTPSGAGNQCCYSADGNLKYAADSYQGSTPDKGHAWGAAPYLKPGYVPEESHWIDDVVSFYYCCLWTGYKDCDKYMDRRPTKDCVDYQPPGTAVAFGDPHIITFDGMSYRFHGRGEFIIAQVDSFVLQGRFSEPALSSPNVSVLTGIALKTQDSSDTVEIQLAPANSVGDIGLDVIVNNEHINLTTDSMYWQDFRGVSVVTEQRSRQKNVTVLLESGIGVQVAASYGLLNVIVTLPPQLKNSVSRGLFGAWDGDQSNDLMPNGQTAPIGSASSPEDIYNFFALTWEVAAEESLFGDPEPRDEMFVPTFAEPTGAPPQTIASVCEDNAQCRYDYMVTQDSHLASSTLKASMWYKTLQDFLKPVDTCGLLNVPYSKKDSYDYTADSTVHVTGCRLGLRLQGETTYTCDAESKQWQPEVTAKCEGQVEDAGLGMKIGIGLGVVGGCAAVVIIIIIITRCRASKKSKDKGSASRDTELRPETKVPSRSGYAPARTSEDIEDMRPKVKPRSKQTSENSV
ncbi:sushi domain-containing protein 2-like [Liolophura sinensis]|uniref:sushi domain-containing protein 2-like n=1 Tax=Liolophura sinensis TaxID=3198878 RepID=UPI0031582301